MRFFKELEDEIGLMFQGRLARVPSDLFPMTRSPAVSFILLWVMALLTVGESGAKLIYVKSGNDGGDGTSWQNAYAELRVAISAAEAGDEIWVTKGRYLPALEANGRPFLVDKSLKVYGGFTGNETSRDQADPEANITVLSGDLNGDDEADGFGITRSYNDQGEKGGNFIYSVLKVENATDVVIDGLVICGGEGIGAAGGVTCLGRGSVLISRCLICGNTGRWGGGINVSGEIILTIRDSQILENGAKGGWGGGIVSAVDLVIIERCWIRGNVSDGRAGAVLIENNDGKVIIRDSLISGNYAKDRGGALQSYFKGSLFDLTNVTVGGNRFERADSGAIHIGGGARLIARNSIFWGNEGELAGDLSSMLLTNCLVAGSGGSEGWWDEPIADGGGNIDVNPQFVAPFDWREAPSSGGDYALFSGSPAIGRGDASLTDSQRDLLGNQRVMGTGLELGAIEFFEEKEVRGEVPEEAAPSSQAWVYWLAGGCGVLLVFVSWLVVKRKTSQARGEIEEVKKQLEAVLERQKNFTSETSHELRSPISVILGHCELALAESNSPEQTREAVKACQRAGERIRNLTESLFELSQIEGGNIELEFAECSLREVAVEALDLVEPSASQKGVKLNEEVSDLSLNANGDRLWQVMVNLLNNAIRHTPSGKVVTLKAELLGDVVELSVIDQGEGIPAKDIPHLFEKFYKGEGGETGLGLAICEAIVRAHRGTLTVESEPGVETRFMVRLPL